MRFSSIDLNKNRLLFIMVAAAALLAVVVGVSISFSWRAIYLFLAAAALVIMLVMSNIRRATLLVSLMVLVAPYYQYRFDAPGVPFHLTFHRIILALAVPAVLLSLEWGKNRFAGRKGNQQRLSFAVLTAMWLLAWFVMEILASMRSDTSLGFVRLFPRTTGILTTAIIVLYANDLKRINWTLVIFVASAVIPALVALWQTGVFLATGSFPGVPFQSVLADNLTLFDQAYKGAQFTSAPGIGILPRSASVMVDPNYLSAFLSSATIAAIGLLVLRDTRTDEKYPTYLSVLVIGILIAANLITFSRSGLFGLLAGVIVLIWLHPGVRRLRSSLSSLVFVTILFFGIYSIIRSQTFEASSVILFSRFSLSGVESGAYDRLPAIYAGIDTFFSNPIFGVGAANMLRTSHFFTAHSSPITILVEYGLIGFMLFFGMIFLLHTTIIRSIINSRDGKDTHFARSTGATVGAANVCILVTTVPYDHLLTLEVNWILLGLLIATSIVMARQLELKTNLGRSLNRL